MQNVFHNVWIKISHAAHKHVAGFDKTHHAVHLGYFAAVFVEGHGVYASFGGLLLVMGVIAIFVEHVTEV